MLFNSYYEDYEFSINLSKDLNASKSSNSLFEILLEKYSMKNFQNTFDILDLSILIDLLVKPFDNFDEETYFNQVIEENLRENSMNVVRIPYLVLKREPLKAISEIFIHENCNREIFNHLTSIISRLSKINHNRLALIEILSDIIVELSTISISRLSKLLSSLDNMKTNATEKRIINSSVLSKINDFGGQIHEKFLNTLKTFKSLAMKSNSDFIDIIPTKEISPLWKLLDSILLSLHIYLEDDNESSNEISMYSKKEATHTSLVLLFIKLLPMIEAFLIIYASEIKEKEQSSTENAAALSSPTSSPGEKHRQSANYNKFNLSLSSLQNSPSQEVNTLLARSISFQKSKSAFLNNLNSHSTILYQFVSSHSRILNSLINYKPTLLEDTLSPLINVIQLRPFLSFENKKNYFYSTIKKSKGLRSRRSINLNIRRDEVFENSFNQLRMKTTEELRSRLVITFNGEEGIDAGGLTREWYQILSKEIFNPNYVLFLPTVDGSTFQPNPLSYYNSNHLDYFKFVGRIIGKALVDGQMMDAHFTRSLYKHLLGIHVDFSDIEAIDPEYYKSLNQILNFPLETLGLELYFTAESLTFGKHEVVELKKNGTKILVDDSNKLEYVNLISQHRMTNAIRSQIESFLDGFYDLVPPELISIFSPSEVELLICGLPDVDIEDLRLNTEYHQYRPSDQIICFFWDCLRSFNREEKAAFLQFVTGSSKVIIFYD
jgi:E3 ubiquitin-protein ligase HUWE1